MSKVIKVKKGLDIKLKGKAEQIITQANESATFAIKPTDFPGLTAKLSVKVGDKVKTGSPLFFDKYRPEVKFTSPVTGEVTSINRGERRKLLEIVITADSQEEFVEFSSGNISSLKREDIIATLLESGLWPFVKQRPYAVIANPADTPKAVFVSAFDSAPLAPDYAFIVNEDKDSFQQGIDVLAKLTQGSVHLNTSAEQLANNPFSSIKNVEITSFDGPHPAGNVGVQINKISPINKGEVIWTVNPQDVIAIGKLFATGKLNTSKIVALAGSEASKPMYYKTKLGAQISSITQGNVNEGNVRYISGNALTGTTVAPKGYLGFYDSSISVIEEGNEMEFMGWASPGFGKFSLSRSFFSWLSPKKEYKIDTNYHGGERAFVFTGEYERVLPMDIYPMQLLKAILAEDIDLMEQLGIYEVAEEDFALCEFICPSKQEIQSIIRQGIDMMIKEFS